jgi:hypothetical protein
MQSGDICRDDNPDELPELFSGIPWGGLQVVIDCQMRVVEALQSHTQTPFTIRFKLEHIDSSCGNSAGRAELVCQAVTL